MPLPSLLLFLVPSRQVSGWHLQSPAHQSLVQTHGAPAPFQALPLHLLSLCPKQPSVTHSICPPLIACLMSAPSGLIGTHAVLWFTLAKSHLFTCLFASQQENRMNSCLDPGKGHANILQNFPDIFSLEGQRSVFIDLFFKIFLIARIWSLTCVDSSHQPSVAIHGSR
jgi:hypothetical protein